MSGERTGYCGLYEEIKLSVQFRYPILVFGTSISFPAGVIWNPWIPRRVTVLWRLWFFLIGISWGHGDGDFTR